MSTVQNGANDAQILGFFGDEFHKENLHLKSWNFGEWLNLVQGFISIDKKYIVFGVTFSFKCQCVWPITLSLPWDFLQSLLGLPHLYLILSLEIKSNTKQLDQNQSVYFSQVRPLKGIPIQKFQNLSERSTKALHTDIDKEYLELRSRDFPSLKYFRNTCRIPRRVD